jgi:tRNA(Ile)-lysidine synthase
VAISDGECLNVILWRKLSAARRANALRAWLQRTLGRGAAETLVQRLLNDLPEAAHARWPVDAAQQLALYRGRLSVSAPPGQPRDPVSADTIDLSRPGVFALPQWGGALEVRHATAERGVAPGVLTACTLQMRSGGEQFQRAPRDTPRSLKKQYQSAGIAAWQRGGPLVYSGGKLLFVPGLGIDARWLQDERKTDTKHALTLHWRVAPGDA